MPLSDAIEKLGRVIFESPFADRSTAEAAPELAEIRLAVIDAVKAKSHRVGRAQVFSQDRISIQLRGIPADQTTAFESSFLAGFLNQEIREALTRSSIRFSDQLQVELHTTSDLPAEGEDFIHVEAEMTPAAPTEAEPAVRTGWLTVVRGEANAAEIAIAKTRTNVGRTVDVYRTEGPSRRNDLAFVGDSEINRTVSREHAHILLDRKTGEHRLFNDRRYNAGAVSPSECGLWIVRDGLSIPVHRGPRGVLLQAGDEIHLGDAVVKFVNAAAAL